MKDYLACGMMLLLGGVAHAGYDVHITRKQNWSDDKGPRIERKEWDRYWHHHADVRRDLQNTEDDFIVSIASETFPLWFNPRIGELFTKDPSPEAVEKMKQIAKALKAQAQGDEGENL
jgi:hypothetical protein